MKKEELIELGLTEEQADKVLVMNGKAIEAQKALTAAESQKLADASGTIKFLQDAVKKFDGVDVDGLNRQLADLRSGLRST